MLTKWIQFGTAWLRGLDYLKPQMMRKNDESIEVNKVNAARVTIPQHDMYTENDNCEIINLTRNAEKVCKQNDVVTFSESKSDCGQITSQVNEEVNQIKCNERTDMSAQDRESVFTAKDMQCHSASYPEQYDFQRQTHVSHIDIPHDTRFTNDIRNIHASLTMQNMQNSVRFNDEHQLYGTRHNDNASAVRYAGTYVPDYHSTPFDKNKQRTLMQCSPSRNEHFSPQSQSMHSSTFGYALRKLAGKAYPHMQLPEQLLVNLYINGLGDKELKRHVYLSKPDTLDEAIKTASTFEGFDEPKRPFNAGEKTRKPTIGEVNVVKNDSANLKFMKPESSPVGYEFQNCLKEIQLGLEKMDKRLSSLEQTPRLSQHQRQQQQTRPIECFKCKGPHYQRDCPQLLQHNQSTNFGNRTNNQNTVNHSGGQMQNLN